MTFLHRSEQEITPNSEKPTVVNSLTKLRNTQAFEICIQRTELYIPLDVKLEQLGTEIGIPFKANDNQTDSMARCLLLQVFYGLNGIMFQDIAKGINYEGYDIPPFVAKMSATRYQLEFNRTVTQTSKKIRKENRQRQKIQGFENVPSAIERFQLYNKILQKYIDNTHPIVLQE